MLKHTRSRWERLLRYITSGPARLAAGSVASGPLGLLAVEQERVRARHLCHEPAGGPDRRRVPRGRGGGRGSCAITTPDERCGDEPPRYEQPRAEIVCTPPPGPGEPRNGIRATGEWAAP